MRARDELTAEVVAMRLKVREDELRLNEIRRLEAEQGSALEQAPVQLSPAAPLMLPNAEGK